MADYIDRQDAIVALREFAEKCKGSTEAATAAVMAISVILRLPGPWVSVEDSQPVLHKRIFLRVGIGGVITGWAYVGYGGGIGYVDDNGNRVTGVTGWMELPDAQEVTTWWTGTGDKRIPGGAGAGTTLTAIKED